MEGDDVLYSVKQRIQGYNKIIGAVLFSIMGERHCLLSLVVLSPLEEKGTVTSFMKNRNIQYQKGYKMASESLKILTLFRPILFLFFSPEIMGYILFKQLSVFLWTILLKLVVHVYLGLSFNHFHWERAVRTVVLCRWW